MNWILYGMLVGLFIAFIVVAVKLKQLEDRITCANNYSDANYNENILLRAEVNNLYELAQSGDMRYKDIMSLLGKGS